MKPYRAYVGTYLYLSKRMADYVESDDHYESSDSGTWGRVQCEDELQPGSEDLGLHRDYVESWNLQDAFREFYQNW